MGAVLLTTVSLSALLIRAADLMIGCGGLVLSSRRRVTVILFVL